MVLTRKPNPQKKQDLLVEQIIAKGGSVSSERKIDEGKTHIKLPIPVKLLQAVDEARKKKYDIKPRVIWILEALIEKLEREQEKNH